jgi:hypothetical protein
MTKRLTIVLIALVALVLVAVLPVSATYYNINNTLTSMGGTVYIGEQQLDISSAVAPGSQIGWWASPANVGTTSPTTTLLVMTPTNFSVSPGTFLPYTGNWYPVVGGVGNTANGPVFTVVDPSLAVDIWDLNTATTVTGGNITQGDYLAFRINSNLDQALNPAYRAQSLISTDYGNVDIKVKSASGNTYIALFNGMGLSTTPLTQQNVSSPLWYWGTTDGNVPSSANAAPNWSTGAVDASSNNAYPAGVYTVIAQSRLNGMYDNYLNGGATYTGKTVSQTATVRIVAAKPTVTSISPALGPLTAGTSVTITGTGFTGATKVYFGTNAATSFTVINAIMITATAPAVLAGTTVNVTVTTPAGTSAAVSADQYTYQGVPVVTKVALNTGPLGGGIPVTITGSSFTGATNVYFGGIPAPSYVVNGATSITATPPGNGAGTVNVTVTTPGGTSTMNLTGDLFTYEGPPAVTKVNPNSGTTAGGTSVTITGTNLLGATNVNFGGTPATSYTVTSATSITATSPAVQSGSVIVVTVITPSGTSATVPADQFTYVGSTQSSIAVTRSMPATATPGASIIVTLTPGTTFATSPGWGVTETLPTGWTFVSTTADNWSVPGGAYQFAELSATPITYTVTAPSTSGAYTFNGTYIDGNKGTGTVLGAVSVTVKPNPLLTYDTNHDGYIEKSEAVAALTDYLFNNTLSKADCVTVITAYLFVTPVSSTPTVLGVSPPSGMTSGGTSVTITGYAFTNATGVMFGSTPASSFTVNSDASITAFSPGAGPVGSVVNVTVTTPVGTSATSAADQFTYIAPPTVTGVSPSVGTKSGGTTVTITGYGFTGATQVSFGGTPASSWTFNSDTSITATSPAGTPGTIDVTVWIGSLPSAVSAADQFTYNT